MRCAALLLIITVPLPAAAVHVFGPQHAAWIPLSPTRTAGRWLTITSGDPWTAGPTAGCGHAGQPCASAATLDLSPVRAWGGIATPRDSRESAGRHRARAADHRADGDVGRCERRNRTGAEH